MLAMTACAASVPTVEAPTWRPGDASEWHVCPGGGVCREGWACVAGGCEWCGDDDGVATRCTQGNDG